MFRVRNALMDRSLHDRHIASLSVECVTHPALFPLPSPASLPSDAGLGHSLVRSFCSRPQGCVPCVPPPPAGAGLEHLGEKILAKKREEEARKGETVWDAYLRKRKEKRRERKHGRRLGRGGDEDSSDSGDYDAIEDGPGDRGRGKPVSDKGMWSPSDFVKPAGLWTDMEPPPLKTTQGPPIG